ncbi:cytoplasmic protein [Pseudomonas sp. S2_C03]
MHTHRLIIRQHDKLLGHFDSSTPDARDAIREIASRFPESEGFEVQLFVAQQERRLLESGPEGIRLISIEPVFTSAALEG